MEELSLIEGSVIAVVAVILIKELLNFLKPLVEKVRNPSGVTDKQDSAEVSTRVAELLKEICVDMRATRRLTEDLHKWHDQGRDQDGRFLWYVPMSLEATMAKLADAVSDLSVVLARMKAEGKE